MINRIKLPKVSIGYPAAACLPQYYRAAKIYADKLDELYDNKFVILCCTGTSGLSMATTTIQERGHQNTTLAFVRRDMESPHHTTHRLGMVESPVIKPVPRTGVSEVLYQNCNKVWNYEGINYHMIFVDDFMETGNTFDNVYQAIEDTGAFRPIEGLLTMTSNDKIPGLVEGLPNSIEFITYYNL